MTSAPAAVLAVDVGNSKTDLALVGRDGRLLAAVRGPSASHQAVGLDAAMDQLEQLSSAGARLAGLGPSSRPLAAAGVFCVAGADFPEDLRLLRRGLARTRLAARVTVKNDTIAVLRAGSPDGWGVAVVCGAGINCSGLAPDGRSVHFAALGDISGDWGGGWSVGMAALGAAVRGRDGRGPRTSLERLVPAHFGLRTPDAVTRAIYLGQVPESRVRELAPVAFEASRGGDAVAAAIVDRLADEVVAMAGSAIRRLGLQLAPVHVALGGGMFRGRDERLLERVEAGVHAVAPRATVRPLDAPPVLGSALLGLDLLDAPTDAAARLREMLTEDAIVQV
ncbi:MAG: BadF/BadG/BcrA/BcrD ATPase family protein [Candidatus Limnocylindrales bacterium]|jgi:N-acetylglucosamine kinase-like BadF-type ATPase